jgi:hypothetical protein
MITGGTRVTRAVGTRNSDEEIEACGVGSIPNNKKRMFSHMNLSSPPFPLYACAAKTASQGWKTARWSNSRYAWGWMA